jgi:nitric oxide reductase NorD protein
VSGGTPAALEPVVPSPRTAAPSRFEVHHRRFALLAQAIAGRPLRLEPCALRIDAARLPPPGPDAGTVRVPTGGAVASRDGASGSTADEDDDGLRALRLGVLREALRALDPPPDDPAWLRRDRAVLERRVRALLERARIDAALRRRLPGAARDVDRSAARALAALGPARTGDGPRALLDALARGVLDASPPGDADRCGPRARLHAEVAAVRRAQADGVTSRDAAHRVVALLVAAAAARAGAGDRIVVDALEPVSDAPAPPGPDGSGTRGGEDPAHAPPSDAGAAGAPTDGEHAREGRPGGGRGADPEGAVVVEPAAEPPALDAFGRPRPARAAIPRRPPPGGTLVDEWDSVNGVVLRAWCRVVEARLRGDDLQFLAAAKRRHAPLWDELRRRLARTRPAGRRRVRGVGDGDELDLDGLVGSVVDRRAGHSNDERAYARRDPVVRDVAAGFLADLSASTSVALPAVAAAAAAAPPAPAAPTRAGAWADTGALLYGLYDDPPDDPDPPAARRRVIDLERDALALMAAALDALGDTCALWGFSGDGRDRVEFMVAKDFADPLSPSIGAALAAMQPRGSTRMGAAIRHAAAKLRREPASRRLLVVLSDGYPQDSDYGPDRLDIEYGIRDTARALADAERDGIATFCVTVDPAGHDYLGRMCPPRRYRVIDDLPALPAVLAEVYASLTGRG